MPRLWVLLLVVWYRAVSMATTQHVHHVQLSNNHHGHSSANEQASNFRWHHNHHKQIRQKRSTDDNLKNGATDGKSEQLSSFSSGRIEENDISGDDKQNKNKEESSSGFNEVYKDDSFDGLLNTMSSYNTDSYSNDILKDKEILDSILEKCLSHIKVKKSFNAWGGKRSSSEDNDIVTIGCWNLLEQLRRENDLYDAFDKTKRHKFSSWGGKRNTDDDNGPKRLPFRAWGGKREQSEQPKRVPFGPWKGKRPDEELDSLMIPFKEDYKRTTFNSWGGKRSFNHNSFIPMQHFSYNAMTSSLDDDNNSGGFGPVLYRNTPFPWQIYKELAVGPSATYPDLNEQRRIKFNSWGGKRTEDDEISDISEDKRTFNAWGGKRGLATRTFNAWGGKRKLFGGDYPIYEGSKRTFNAWGG